MKDIVFEINYPFIEVDVSRTEQIYSVNSKNKYVGTAVRYSFNFHKILRNLSCNVREVLINP